MATPKDPYRVDIPGVPPAAPAPRVPLNSTTSPANFQTPRTRPGTVRPEIPLYPGGDASKPAASVVPRPERAVGMQRAIEANNERIATQGVAMRAAAEAKNAPPRPVVPTATGVGNGDTGRPAAVEAAVARAASAPKPAAPTPPAPRAPAPTDADYDPFAGYSDADIRAGKVDVTEANTGYFIGSDGRVKRINSSYANDPKNQVPSMSRRGLTPEELSAVGFGNKDEGNVSLAMASGTNPLDETYGRSPTAPAGASNGAQLLDTVRGALGPTPNAGLKVGETNPRTGQRVMSTAEQAEAYFSGRTTPTGAPTLTGSTTPTGTPTLTNGTGMSRRSALDEFNAIREGIAMPGRYDPSGAASRARRAAGDVVRGGTDANQVIQMAANIASDPRLKGFPGARNAIIAGIVGQLDAGNSAALEGLRQQGQAGISAQDFDQAGVLQETGRRGQTLRDQFLAENAERLAALNNDAAMERTIMQGALSLAGRDGNGRGAGSKADNTVIDRYAEQAAEQNPDDPLQAAADTITNTRRAGVDPVGTYSGNESLGVIRDALSGALNNGMPRGAEAYLLGLDGQERATIPDDYDFSNARIVPDGEASNLLNFTNFFTPKEWESYVLELEEGNPNSRRAFSPLMGAPDRLQTSAALRATRRRPEEE